MPTVGAARQGTGFAVTERASPEQDELRSMETGFA